MRDYGKISPKFWTQGTGKALRGHPEAQIVAMYLMTCPLSEMTGVFYCPLWTIAGETGLGDEGASKGLARLVEMDFCTFEGESETMFVHEMAKYQIGEELKPLDNQVKGIRKAYAAMKGLIKSRFYERYAKAFHLPEEEKTQAPYKPLRSQEQEQEQKHEQEQEQEQDQEHDHDQDKTVAAAKAAPPKKSELDPERKAACREAWESYSAAYLDRYQAEPVRNAKVNRNIVDFVARLGFEESPHVAAFYVSHNGAHYVRAMHSVGLMLQDAEKLRTEWVTGNRMTATRAQQVDRTQTNFDAFAPLIAAAEAEDNHVES